MSHQPREKLARAAWTLQETIKDSVIQNIVSALNDGRIKLEKPQAQALHILVGQAVEAGYHRVYPSFMKEVDAALTESTKSESDGRKAKKAATAG